MCEGIGWISWIQDATLDDLVQARDNLEAKESKDTWDDELHESLEDAIREQEGPNPKSSLVKGPRGIDLTEALKSGDLDEIAKQNGLDFKGDKTWAKPKNPGLKRMRLGNILRAKLRRGEDVYIGDHHFNTVEESL